MVKSEKDSGGHLDDANEKIPYVSLRETSETKRFMYSPPTIWYVSHI